MKILFYLFVFACFCRINGQNFATNSDNFSNSQIAGYSLFGLGFTTVAYTYTNYNNMPDGSNEAALYYSIGAGMALAGVIVLLSSPRKKHKQNAWSCIALPDPSCSFVRYGERPWRWSRFKNFN